eukprot:m.114519 g.114519  ORF g.114519 m.114519 type:complete len:463 (+) comp14170_c0_seq4:223-1611(+)
MSDSDDSDSSGEYAVFRDIKKITVQAESTVPPPNNSRSNVKATVRRTQENPFPTDQHENTFYSGEWNGEPVYVSSTPPERKHKLVRRPSDREHELCSVLSHTVPKKLERSNLILDELLGQGAFGKVYRGVAYEDRESQDPGPKTYIEVAVKELKQGLTGKARVHFLQEADLLTQFSHENIVGIIGAVLGSDPLWIVLELCQHSLLWYLRNNREGIEDKLRLCQEVANGCCYLAGRLFVHRDLASRNVLTTTGGHCKIADFGMSCPLASDSDYYKSSGGRIPIRWSAPECINYRKYSVASDVWAYGIVCHEIFSNGDIPYGRVPGRVIAEMISQGAHLNAPEHCPGAIYIEIMLRCWEYQPSKRISFPDILSTLKKIEDTGNFVPMKARHNATAWKQWEEQSDDESSPDEKVYESIDGVLALSKEVQVKQTETKRRAVKPTLRAPPPEAPPPPLRRRAPDVKL